MTVGDALVVCDFNWENAGLPQLISLYGGPPTDQIQAAHEPGEQERSILKRLLADAGVG